MSKIAVIGAGSWGLALTLLLNEKGYDLSVWCYTEEEQNDILQHREHKRCLPGIKIPLEIQFSTQLKEVLEGAEIVLMAVPSEFVRQTTEQLKPFINETAIIVNVSKGIEKGTYLRLSEVITSILPNPVVVLSGPSHAEEVARHIPTTVVVSSQDLEKAQYIQDVFANHYFRVYVNEDLKGVELGGALKNVIALAAGVIEGMGYGDNTKAALMTRGISEIARLGVAMGGKPETFAGLSGIGDLIVTCTSGHSRNRRAGELLAQGYSLQQVIEKVNMVVEGIPTTESAYGLMQQYHVEMPILSAVYRVLCGEETPKECVEELMKRDKKHEK